MSLAVQVFLFLSFMLLALFWPLRTDNLVFILLRRKVSPWIYWIGLSHTWRLFSQTDWTGRRRVQIRFKDKKSAVKRIFEPEGYEWKKWFAEIGLIENLPDEPLKVCLGFMAQKYAMAPEIMRIELTVIHGPRPSVPLRWRDKFDNFAETNEYVWASLTRVPSGSWKFHRAVLQGEKSETSNV
jgi:hypothetical protein